MPEFKEASVLINSQQLSFGEAMTLRVAVTHYLSVLQDEGLGDDEMGHKICESYVECCHAILRKMLG